MNREQEYRSLLDELENTPPALEHTVARAQARVKRTQNIRRYFIMPASSVAALFLAFVTLVNLSMPFALACEKIPVLRELAAAVSFSPSLSAAVENDYVQTINQEQTINDITMRVEYLIVDQKQLNIFYTLQSDRYLEMDATPSILGSDGQTLDGFSIWAAGQGENGELRQVVIDFDKDMPDSLTLICRVHDNGSPQMSALEPDRVGDTPEKIVEPQVISVFEFLLCFDPALTQQGETITLNQDFIIDGQRLTVTSIEIYPTHMRVNFVADEHNTAWLISLGFYFENEKGERFEVISNGITATGDIDSPMMVSHRLESAFFYQSDTLTMTITNVVWLDKDMEQVLVNLVNMKADKLPESVAFEQATRKGGSWELTFSAAERSEGNVYQLFGASYFDENGNEYMIDSWWLRTGSYYDEATGDYYEKPGVFNVLFTLKDYPYDTVYLSPSYSRTAVLETPVEIAVK